MVAISAVGLLQERVVVVDVASRVDWLVSDWVVGGMAGGEIGAREGVWVHRGYCAGVDRVGDWGMDFYAVGNLSCEYVFVFAGGGYGGRGDSGVDCTFVFWGKERVRGLDLGWV